MNESEVVARYDFVIDDSAMRRGMLITKTSPGWIVSWPDDPTRSPAAFSTWQEVAAWMAEQPKPADAS